MPSKLKVLFMGTPEFAVHILDSIIKADFNVVGVVTVADKPAGRGQKMHESAVAQYAKIHELNLLQPEKLKSKAFLAAMESLEIDVAVVVAFRMLPEVVWRIPKLGTFNLHASLLPNYRGAAPINWAIINNETVSGVTTFLIDEKIDTGNILLQKEVAIQSTDTAGDLHDQLMLVGGDLVVETLKGLENGSLKGEPQKVTNDIKDAPKIFKQDAKIDWNQSIDSIYNLIRGMSPYPTAWTEIEQKGEIKTLKIFSSKIEKGQVLGNVNDWIKENQRLGVQLTQGIIWLEDIQLEGKKRMKITDFLNGFNHLESKLLV